MCGAAVCSAGFHSRRWRRAIAAILHARRCAGQILVVLEQSLEAENRGRTLELLRTDRSRGEPRIFGAKSVLQGLRQRCTRTRGRPQRRRGDVAHGSAKRL